MTLHVPTLAKAAVANWNLALDRAEAAEAELAALRAEIERLRGKLEHFGGHRDECRRLFSANPRTCGFEAAIQPKVETANDQTE